MPRYVIHIGPHRTASTYLQTAFRALHPELRAQGVLYPMTLFGGQGPGHEGIVKRLKAFADGELAGEFLRMNGSKFDTILLSAEDLATLPSDRLVALKNLLGTQPAEIVFYARRWSEIITSHWHGTVKTGSIVTLEETFLRHLTRPYESNVTNPARVLDRFAAIFGKENIRVACYNVLRDEQTDLIDHFAATFLGLPAHQLADRSRQNESLGIIDTEIIRAVNTVRTKRGEWPFPWTHLGRMKPELDLALLTGEMERDVAALHINDSASPFQELHAHLARAYKNNIVAPKLDLGLYAPRQADVKYVQGNYVFVPGVADALRVLEAKLCEPIDAFLTTLTTPANDREAVPAGFNARRYLMRNLDVLESKVDPYTHYRRSGIKEGRRW